jgi:hypothetical protein
MNCELFNHKGKWENYDNYFAYNNHIPHMLKLLELTIHMLKLKIKKYYLLLVLWYMNSYTKWGEKFGESSKLLVIMSFLCFQ